ncbi:MAG: hypothetical protein H6R26_1849, partial [Proteobacteria bacterium]|nr:hypothetical protein [Pseudomonadota bacterium]
VSGKEIRLAGRVSPLARKALESMGWKVQDSQAGQLID